MTRLRLAKRVFIFNSTINTPFACATTATLHVCLCLHCICILVVVGCFSTNLNNPTKKNGNAEPTQQQKLHYTLITLVMYITDVCLYVMCKYLNNHCVYVTYIITSIVII